MARIFQINLSQGGVPKLPVSEGEVTPLGLEGDDQRNKKHHGGPERALCLYSLDLTLELQAEGHPIFPGSTGENITISGLDWERIKPGDRIRLGKEVVIEITRHTTPCRALGDSFKDGEINRISQDDNPGWARWYARVLSPGWIRIGDRVGFD